MRGANTHSAMIYRFFGWTVVVVFSAACWYFTLRWIF